MKKYAVGIDYSGESAEALRQALRMAQADGGTVVAVHVFDEAVLDDLQRQVSIDEAHLMDGSRRRLQDFIHSLVGESPASAEVVAGHPFEELVKFARRTGADCLVLGVRGQTHRAGAAGELAVKCVRKAPLPVMLVAESGTRRFRQVVACIDFSPMSEPVARAAVEMAKREEAELHFLHVYRPLGLIMGAMDQYVPAYPLLPEEEMVAGVRQELDAFVAALDPAAAGVDVHTKVIDALNVGGAIHDFVAGRQDCLVVLGTVGRTGMRRLLMGTTAEKIVRGTPCSILALKPEGFTSPVG